jgi:hypothetical protein
MLYIVWPYGTTGSMIPSIHVLFQRFFTIGPRYNPPRFLDTPHTVPVWSQDRNFLQNISWYFLCSIVVVRFVDICRTDDHQYLNILFIKIVIHTSKQHDTGMGIHTMLWLSQRKGRYCGYRTRKRLSYYITQSGPGFRPAHYQVLATDWHIIRSWLQIGTLSGPGFRPAHYQVLASDRHIIRGPIF